RLCNNELACLQRLQWLIHYTVLNPVSEAVANTVFGTSGNSAWPAWPGRGFVPYDSVYGQPAKALIGCPNGHGVAYLLAQHVREYGPRAIDEVRVFGSDSELLCMGWHVAI
ncbi:MAG: hypothetical protein LQ340_003987, partial [Diploschistes diacapsis]